MKSRVTAGKILKSHFKSCQSSIRLYKHLPSKVSDHNLSDRSAQTQIRHDFDVFNHQSMKTRVTTGKILKSHFQSCQSSLRLYKQLPSKVFDHNLSDRSAKTQIRHDIVVFYGQNMKTRVTMGKKLKSLLKSCQSSFRLYKHLSSKVSDHNLSDQSAQTQIKHDFVVFYQ